jgi:cation:H+ antiporter
MLMDLFWGTTGIVLLVFAGDALVKGAVNLALRLGIPALVVGLTVVAFGTSAPELLVSIKALYRDAPGLALGNVVGSNIANVLLVLGIPALISVIHTSQLDTRQSYLTMLAGSVLFVALAFCGVFTWVSGLVLLAGFGLMLWQSFAHARAHRAEMEEEAPEGADPAMRGWKIAGLIVVGLIGLPIGADLLVDSSVNIARDLGVSETIIGLTLVAVGTSLPELATTVMAAMRRSADVAVGNVIGSNIFNLLGIIGLTSLVGQLAVPAEMLSFDVWVMLATSFALIPFILFRHDIGKTVGVVFIAAYAAYVMMLVTWGGTHG